MAVKVPPVDLDDVVARYLSGESVSKIAPSVGVSVAYIYKRLKREGILRSCREAARLAAARKPILPWVLEAIDLYRSGMSQTDVAEHFGVTQSTVQRHFKVHGVSRTRSEAERLKWAGMDAEARANQVAAAHAAVRGMTRPDDDLIRRAIGKQASLAHATAEEREVADALIGLGLEVVLQQAVYKYNVDVGVHPVAVELYGGAWHAHGRHAARFPQRCKDLADRGWNLHIIWAGYPGQPDVLDVSRVTQDVATYYERSSSDPSFRRQYRMIWGHGELIAAGSVDDDNFAPIPSAIRGEYRRRRRH